MEVALAAFVAILALISVGSVSAPLGQKVESFKKYVESKRSDMNVNNS